MLAVHQLYPTSTYFGNSTLGLGFFFHVDVHAIKENTSSILKTIHFVADLAVNEEPIDELEKDVSRGLSFNPHALLGHDHEQFTEEKNDTMHIEKTTPKVQYEEGIPRFPITTATSLSVDEVAQWFVLIMLKLFPKLKLTR